MERKKIDLIKNKMINNNSNNSKVNKISNESKIFLNNECRRNKNLKKRIAAKKDGRYLIYYDF